jgi:tungstate transport system substrate-binding protein
MDDFGDAVELGLTLIVSGDATLYAIIALSLWVSGLAVAIAVVVGLPSGAALAIYPFPGRRGLVILVNSLLGLPPVLVGLAGYLLLSRAGPLGRFGLLYTPSAMVLVHDTDAEQKFIAEGHGLHRREIAWNDFVIVGPSADPAKIEGGRDVIAGFKAIWQAQAPFVSRGDKSGTDALEKRLWKAAALDIAKAGPWYKDIGGGMGPALNAAAGMDAYTLSDRGTWLSFNNRRDLAILLEGDARLINRYDVIELSPKLHGQAKLALAKQFAAWLVSSAGQQAIGAYELAGQKLFHPETDPKP